MNVANFESLSIGLLYSSTKAQIAAWKISSQILRMYPVKNLDSVGAEGCFVLDLL